MALGVPCGACCPAFTLSLLLLLPLLLLLLPPLLQLPLQMLVTRHQNCHTCPCC